MTKALRFLLVDDDSDDTSLFREVLEEVNASVIFHSAGDGQQAIQFLQDETVELPDVIFLDLNMPRMSGKECLVHIKNDEKLHKIPVIMYTTSSQSKDIEETMQKGAICFITKPTNIKELKNILASIADSVHNNLEKTLRNLSNTINTFMVC
jgi:CheY-like chemotaxis protein